MLQLMELVYAISQLIIIIGLALHLIAILVVLQMMVGSEMMPLDHAYNLPQLRTAQPLRGLAIL